MSPKMSPGTLQGATKNETKNEAKNHSKKCMRVFAGSRRICSKIGQGGGGSPRTLRGQTLQGHSKPYEHAPGARGTVADIYRYIQAIIASLWDDIGIILGSVWRHFSGIRMAL